MISGGFSAFEWLVLAEHELLLFAGVFFLIGAVDELTVDVAWIVLRLTGRALTRTFVPSGAGAARTAVFIPAWREERVIGTTMRHMLAVWPDPQLRLYVGCYANDPPTIAAAIAAAKGEDRARIVVLDAAGPTTKADCLNRLYAALEQDEARSGERFASVILHDAEDMVDPAALSLIDRTLGEGADLAQLPVLPLPQEHSRWIGSHYCEEFAEAHGKVLVVRDALRAGIPLAGVGCGIARDMLARLAQSRGGNGPFEPSSLTEDYELGLGVADIGGCTRFVRCRADDGALIATRAYFPDRIDRSVRQKTRWIFGIAFQGWDRLGWSRKPAETWMRLRDRRGPFVALILAAGYLVLAMAAVLWILQFAGLGKPLRPSPALVAIVWLNFAAFVWRAAFRYAFTAREYGIGEGLLALPRIAVANVIAIMAGRRALFAYVRSLFGVEPRWDKTEHHAHPALGAPRAAA